MAKEFLSVCLHQVWQVTILYVLVEWLSRSFLSKYPRLTYAVWFVFLLKCLTPPLWSSPCGIFTWCFSRTFQIAENASIGLVSASVGEAFGWLMIVIWTTGFGIAFARPLVRWSRLQREVLHKQVEVPESLSEIFAKVKQQLQVSNAVQLVVTDAEVGPAIVGLWKPLLVLPRSLVNPNPGKAIEPIIAHELLHVRRGDNWVAILELIVRSVWWFHPGVQNAADRASQFGEYACDQAVLSSIDCQPERYADCLIQILEKQCQLQPLLSQPGMRAYQMTKERLNRVLTYQPKTSGRTGVLLATILSLLVLLPGRPYSKWIVPNTPKYQRSHSKNADEQGGIENASIQNVVARNHHPLGRPIH